MKFSAAVALSFVVASVEGYQLSMSTSYFQTMAGGRSTAVRPKSYAPTGGKPKVVVNNMGSSYLNNVNIYSSPSTSSRVDAPVVASSVTSSTLSPAAYLTNLNGASASTVTSPRGKFSAFSGKKPKVVVSNMGSSDLNKVSGVSATTSVSSTPTTGSYLSNLVGATTSVEKTPRGSYSAFSGKKPKVVVYNMGSSYLSNLKESTSANAPPASSGPYIGNLGGASVASVNQGRFSAFTGKKPKVVVNNMGSSYLNGIRSGASNSALPTYSTSPVSTVTASAPRGSYSPFSGRKPKRVVNNMGSSYLNNVADAKASLSNFAAPSFQSPLVNSNGSTPFKSSSARGSYSPVGKKPKSVVNNMGSNYLNTVNTGSGLPSFVGYSAPVADSSSTSANQASSPVKSWTPYKPLTKSYSLAAGAPAPAVGSAVAAGNYLESLHGGRRW